jgi:hypothetical protein
MKACASGLVDAEVDSGVRCGKHEANGTISQQGSLRPPGSIEEPTFHLILQLQRHQTERLTSRQLMALKRYQSSIKPPDVAFEVESRVAHERLKNVYQVP